LKERYRRGYSVAVLVGLEADVAVLWRVFSNVVKFGVSVRLGGTRSDVKAVYNFHEAVVNALRPVLREGVRSVVLVSPARSSYAKDFLSHVRAHHAWLAQGSGKAVFSEVVGSADSLSKVAVLVKGAVFRQVVSETAASEGEGLVELLEKRLSAVGRDAFVVYSLVEIEDLVFGEWLAGKPKPELLLLTDKYLAGCRARGRLQRLMQVAANRGVKTKIVDAESSAGKRVAQLGGLVLLLSVG
jgi:stalled ribosome rescue protein Dom34